MTTFFIVLLLIVIATLLWFWLPRAERKSKNEAPVYVCPECGEHHCNCYLEEKDS